MTDLASARRLALGLPGTGEEPHFDMSSFRVNGKIFATVPPDGSHLHIFVGDDEIAACVAEGPRAFEPLRWGQQMRGLRILLAAADDDRVAELLPLSPTSRAWAYRLSDKGASSCWFAPICRAIAGE